MSNISVILKPFLPTWKTTHGPPSPAESCCFPSLPSPSLPPCIPSHPLSPSSSRPLACLCAPFPGPSLSLNCSLSDISRPPLALPLPSLQSSWKKIGFPLTFVLQVSEAGLECCPNLLSGPDPGYFSEQRLRCDPPTTTRAGKGCGPCVVPNGYRDLNLPAFLSDFNGEDAMWKKQKLDIGFHRSFSCFALLTLISHWNSRCPWVFVILSYKVNCPGEAAGLLDLFSHTREDGGVCGSTVEGELWQEAL